MLQHSYAAPREFLNKPLCSVTFPLPDSAGVHCLDRLRMPGRQKTRKIPGVACCGRTSAHSGPATAWTALLTRQAAGPDVLRNSKVTDTSTSGCCRPCRGSTTGPDASERPPCLHLPPWHCPCGPRSQCPDIGHGVFQDNCMNSRCVNTSLSGAGARTCCSPAA